MVKFEKVKIITLSKGNIIKFINIKKINLKLKEIYFSEIVKNKFKGWKYHTNRKQIMTIISGSILFQYKYKEDGKVFIKKIEYPKNLYRIFIPKKTYYSFKCVSKKRAIIVNIIDEVII